MPPVPSRSPQGAVPGGGGAPQDPVAAMLAAAQGGGGGGGGGGGPPPGQQVGRKMARSSGVESRCLRQKGQLDVI